MKKAQDILQYLLNQGPDWIDLEKTVDRITHGKPDAPVSRAGVTWMPTNRVIERAIAKNCHLLVVHEPIIWTHHDRMEDTVDLVRARQKKEWLTENNLTIIRCHDLWDKYPEIGIGPSWAKVLGFNDYEVCPYERKQIFVLCHLPEGTTLGEIARKIAQKTVPLGQSVVSMIGAPEMPVRRLVLNIGAWGSKAELMDETLRNFQADAAVATEFTWWREGAWALDTEFGLIHVNHGVSEIAGIRALHNFLAEKIPEIEWLFFEESAPCQWVGVDGII